MKGTLKCKILGHKFLSKKYIGSPALDIERWEYQTLDYCIKCGLSKEELNITK